MFYPIKYNYELGKLGTVSILIQARLHVFESGPAEVGKHERGYALLVGGFGGDLPRENV